MWILLGGQGRGGCSLWLDPCGCLPRTTYLTGGPHRMRAPCVMLCDAVWLPCARVSLDSLGRGFACQGNETLGQIARSHATKTAQHWIRKDGSTGRHAPTPWLPPG